jgi:hypothetical protein
VIFARVQGSPKKKRARRKRADLRLMFSRGWDKSRGNGTNGVKKNEVKAR